MAVKGPGTPRPFWVPVDLVARALNEHSVARAMGHGVSQCARICHKCIPAIVGNIEPFVPVDYPRVRRFDARQQMAVRWTGVCPQAECPVNVYPRAVSMCEQNQVDKRVKRAGIQLSGLQDHDGRSV